MVFSLHRPTAINKVGHAFQRSDDQLINYDTHDKFIRYPMYSTSRYYSVL